MGRRWMVRLHRYQKPRPRGRRTGDGTAAAAGRCCVRRSPSSAGSSVSAANITASTVTTAEKATPGTYGWFIVSMPSSEMTTVMPGEHDRASGGRHRDGRRTSRVSAGGQLAAVPGDDQQRVVDADAEADHRRDRAGPIGHVDDVGEQAPEGESYTDAEQRRGQRQAHRHERSERDKRMIAATSRPAPSAPMLPDWALSIAWPASSTCVPAAVRRRRGRSSRSRRRPGNVRSCCRAARWRTPSCRRPRPGRCRRYPTAW